MRILESYSQRRKSSATVDDMNIGTVYDWAGAVVPTDALLCDGSAVSRTTYASLFAALGTTWGAGDGATTFNLPDLRGRTTIGDGTGTGLTARVLGTNVGTETHQLTTAQLASHNHSYQVASGSFGVTAGTDADCWTSVPNTTTGNSGGAATHPNMQPSAVVKKVIKAL